MTSQTAHVSFPLSMLSDDQLAGFFSVAVTVWSQLAEALSFCSGTILRDEAVRRDGNRVAGRNDAEPADGFAVDFELWSDKDLADALAVLKETSYSVQHAQFGEFVDEWIKAITLAVAYRLRNSTDARNSVSFLNRIGASNANPEAN